MNICNKTLEKLERSKSSIESRKRSIYDEFFSFSANLFQNDMLDAIFVTLSLLLLLLTTFLVTLSFCFFFELLSLKSFGRNKSMDGIRYENEFQLTWRRLKKSNDFSTKKKKSNMSNHNLHKLSSDFQFKNDFTL